jgi:hypothetical protein
MLAGCANQIPPTGGPVDMTRPQIVAVYPDSNARNFNGHEIQFEFDRYVEERSVEESIFISPYIGDLDFDWSGKSVTVKFPGPLRRNTTYVVNIGTDVRDLNRGQQRMAQAYSLAFSTGPEIDRGALEGLVIPAKESDTRSGIMIFAYLLEGVNPDTLNPAAATPDFITQTGVHGEFFLRHIPFGSYRILAVRDEYRNLIYDKGVDEFGVPATEIKIDAKDSLLTGIFLKLAKDDTTGPRLTKVAAIDNRHLSAEFSRSLDPKSIDTNSFSLIDTVTQQPLKILLVFALPNVRTSVGFITDAQDSTKSYRLNALNVRDSIGNNVNPLACSLPLQGSPKTDSLPPRLSAVSIKDSVRGVDLHTALTLTFSDAMDRESPMDSIVLLDSRKVPVPVKKNWESDVVLTIKPDQELASKAWYTLQGSFRTFKSWDQKICRDSVRAWRFETLDAEDLSSIEGSVADQNMIDTTGKIFINAVQFGGKAPLSYTVAADATGHFFFPELSEGRYVLQAFRDRNGNGTYDFGKPFPYHVSERLSAFSDTLKARARWPYEGVQLMMK